MAARKVILTSIIGGKSQRVTDLAESKYHAMEAYGWADLWHLARGGDPEDGISLEKHALDAFKVIRDARKGRGPTLSGEYRPDIDVIETDFLSMILLFGDDLGQKLVALLTIHRVPDQFRKPGGEQ